MMDARVLTATDALKISQGEVEDSEAETLSDALFWVNQVARSGRTSHTMYFSRMDTAMMVSRELHELGYRTTMKKEEGSNGVHLTIDWSPHVPHSPEVKESHTMDLKKVIQILSGIPTSTETNVEGILVDENGVTFNVKYLGTPIELQPGVEYPFTGEGTRFTMFLNPLGCPVICYEEGDKKIALMAITPAGIQMIGVPNSVESLPLDNDRKLKIIQPK